MKYIGILLECQNNRHETDRACSMHGKDRHKNGKRNLKTELDLENKAYMGKAEMGARVA